MSLFKFLVDKKVTILCFTLLMAFITLVIRFDGSAQVSVGNLIYINVASFVFFIIYLIASYQYYSGYFKRLSHIAENEKDEILNRLPSPKSYEQVIFQQILAALYNEQSTKMQKLFEQKKDYEEFITSWVHQVKTPIAVSRLSIETESTPSNEEILSSLEEELDKIDHYIEQALYYSKIDDFSRDYLINEVEMFGLVKGAVRKQSKAFINKQINVEIAPIDFTVTTDKKWFSFILDQVLSNALKYTSSGGKIKIYGLIEGKVQKLVIEDNGIGVKPEDIDRVFDKGFTGFNGRENYKSTGIGLYLSKKLAEKLGHDIAIESQYGSYTKLIISFPKLSDYFQVSKQEL